MTARSRLDPAAAEGDSGVPVVGSVVVLLPLLLALWASVNAQRLAAATYLGASSIMADFGITAGPAGLLVAAYFPAYGLMQLPAGLLVDRLAPRALLLWALSLLAASNLVFALAPGLEWAVAARFAVGLSSGPIWLACLKTVASLSLRQYPRRVGSLVTAGSFGALISLGGLPLLLAVLPWRIVALLLAAPLLLLLPLLALAPLPSPPVRERQPVGALLAGLGPALRSPGFWWLALPAIAWNGAYFGVLAWFARYARDVLALPTALIGILPGLISLGLLFGGILAGSLHSRWRPLGPWLFYGGGVLSMLAVALLPALPRLGMSWLLYLLAPLIGLLFGGYFVWIGLMSERVPANRLGTVTGLLNGLTFVSAFLDPWLVGVILDLVDRPVTADPTYSPLAYGAGLLFLAATMALGLAGGAVVGRRTKDK